MPSKEKDESVAHWNQFLNVFLLWLRIWIWKKIEWGRKRSRDSGIQDTQLYDGNFFSPLLINILHITFFWLLVLLLLLFIYLYLSHRRDKYNFFSLVLFIFFFNFALFIFFFVIYFALKRQKERKRSALRVYILSMSMSPDWLCLCMCVVCSFVKSFSMASPMNGSKAVWLLHIDNLHIVGSLFFLSPATLSARFFFLHTRFSSSTPTMDFILNICEYDHLTVLKHWLFQWDDFGAGLRYIVRCIYNIYHCASSTSHDSTLNRISKKKKHHHRWRCGRKIERK